MTAYLAPNGDYSGDGNRKSGEKSHDVTYKLVSTAPIDTGTAWGIAWNQMNNQYPFFRGCILRTVKVSGKQDNYGTVYEVVGHYVKEPKDANPRFAALHFSTRGGREKKVHSFSTTRYKAADAPSEAPDFKHGIGFNNGIFQGVDCVTPKMGFSIEADLTADEFGPAQLAYMHNITGSVNQQAMWIFPIGSVLFLGVTGNSHREKNEITGNYDLWFRVNFEFEASPPIINGTIPPFTNVTKQGMQYFWVMHADQKDSTSGITIPKPVAGYVETVYDYSDFSWFNTLKW